ncbi:hypothetical protein KC19_VG177600 [Ceratodon purpureus]|uniref:Uncharacterized protein n=1 Tax=Ceratodon purpureus TaxID=3225 RepID=A0A8T0HR71_CERPU|nr:hypothetical protein KC19_VG177600 [Ceratodon purpureus]
MEFVDRRRLSPDDSNFKRRMKTPVQLEALERVFADDRYPAEAVRQELSSQLNLSDKQLQMWFCHRRLKDKKGKDEDSPSANANINMNINANANVSRKKPRTEKQQNPSHYGVVLSSEPGDAAMHSGEQYAEEYQYDAEGFTPEESKARPRKSGPREGACPGKRRNQALAAKVAKTEAAAIAAVEAQLGEPLREDGPPLGVEFDTLPPGAFSANAQVPLEPGPALEEPFQPERMHEIPDLQNSRAAAPSATLGLPSMHIPGGLKRKSMGPPSTHLLPIHYEPRPVREYQFLPEQPERLEENQCYERATALNLFPAPERTTLELLQQSRAEEARLQKEMEMQEKRIRKEFEKQEVQRRKREEQMRKEQDRIEKERKREEERIRRDRLKEQERIEREQKKEADRLEKETKRVEKQRRREEARKEKQAAKMKAANERALAKRLAKEMTDLMDDEELERMEAAAAASSLNLAYFASFGKKGLDASQVELKPFPPPTVRMKAVVSIQPWSNSDLNVGNLLLVWRFLTTFADVVGLWPFTLDELVQAYHDYDSRLLGEIHVALLRTLVRDIEEAAQAVSGGMVGQRDAIAMAAGGHPQLVETAFAWGFDIREWGRHVNPVTWPEVLRQFALAAGFGPKWKTRKVVLDRSKEGPTEGEDGQDIVANLRSGQAAANAVASMQGRGMGHLRRSQYRLTPGTVKYAAFHILSLEGDKGLNIVEVADRIQTSGLRDLSSSRTPEASIAAALSRDTILFERTAPSTYCVRSQFRKDSEDADEILSAARERIRLFRSGFVDGEEADKDGDEADREEYESEGQDVDDVEEMEEEELDEDRLPDSAVKKAVVKTEDVKVEADSQEIKQKFCSDPEISEGADGGSKFNEVSVPANKVEEGDEDDEEEEEQEHDVVKDDGQHDDHKAEIQLEEETEIDESQVGEPWVQGLVEGEYADLSVEERLNALVALVTVVNEGNAIRIALEERLEAATALKRQMWAEMQLEKRRHKEELLSRSHFPPLPGITKTDGESPDPENMASGNLSLYDQGQLDMNVPNTEGAGLGEAFVGNGKIVIGLFNGLVVHEAGPSVGGTPGNHLAEKSRAQAKADIGLRAEELYVFRSQPLGSDRRRNRYWQFVTGNSGQDPGCGRLFFESNSDGYWGVIDTEEAFDALLASLDPRGAREAALTAILNRLEASLRQGMNLKSSGIAHSSTAAFDKRLSKQPLKGMEERPASNISGSESDTSEIVGAISVELGKSSREQKQALDRYRETEKWIWSECSTGGSVPKATRVGQRREARILLFCDLCHDLYTNKDKHCQCCHATFDKSSSPRQFSDHAKDCEEKKRRGDPNWKLQGPVVSMPSRLQLLKVEIIKIESAIPAKALKEWTDEQRKAWAASLKSASEPVQVLQALTNLENIIEREWLSSTYETTEEITSTGTRAGSFGSQGPVPFWVPPTTAAVALRIRLLDNAIAYSQEAKEVREKQEIEDEINQKNTKMSTFRFTPEGLPGDQDDEQPADVLETVPSTSGKGRSRVRSSGGGKARGGKGSQSAPGRQGEGRSRKSTISTGGGSKSRVRSSSSSAKKGLKRKLQFQEGAGDAAPSDSKPVWGGAAKGRSARSAGSRGGKTTKRPSRAQAGPRSRFRRGQIASRKPGQKQRNTNELMFPSGETRSKKAKVALDDAAAKAEAEEDDEMEEESNGGDSLAGYADEGDQYEDGDQYNDDGDAEEQNGSDEGDRIEEEEEVDEEQVDEEAEEELEDDDGDGDGEGQEEDDGYDKEGPGIHVYGRDADDVEEEEEEVEEAGGDETEDEDTNQERHSYSDEE